jgi:hypothetical protein
MPVKTLEVMRPKTAKARSAYSIASVKHTGSQADATLVSAFSSEP